MTDLSHHEMGTVRLIIAFGGDAWSCALERFPDLPVLAVNYGNIGFPPT